MGMAVRATTTTLVKSGRNGEQTENNPLNGGALA